MAVNAHHPSGTEPQTEDVVVARVYTDDPGRIQQLGRDHDVWFYIWREGYVMLRTDRKRLPSDAVIEEALSRELVPASEPFRGSGTIPARECYRTVEQTYADLQSIASSRPDLAQWLDYGDSWEKTQGFGGFDMQTLVLTNQGIAGPKPVFMVMAAMHARELATAESATRFAEMLFEAYGTDPDITWMLDYFEIHILPQQNPDGRKMAEAECSSSSCSPGWRKNTNQNYCGATSSARGADLNRNSASSFWGGPSASGIECSGTYRGPSAASEPETSSVEAYAASVFPDFRVDAPGDLVTPADPDADGVFVSLHSSGDIVFYPWEGVDSAPPNQAGLRALAQKMGFSTTFAACQNCFLGPASGTTTDNVYEKLGIAAYTFEIGSDFGESCSSFEATVLPQTLAGLMSGLKHSRQAYKSSQGPDVLNVEFESVSGTQGLLTALADDTRRAVNNGGEAVDAGQNITQIRFTIGLPPWLASESFAMSSDDGAFDETVESASSMIGPLQLSGPEQLIYVYAVDADGHQGPPTAVWGSLDRLFDNSFED